MVGVCGSDVHYYETGRIGSQIIEFPYIVGHECAATVADVGPAVKNVKVADRVVIDPAVACYKCDQCLVGRENTCRNLKFLACPNQLQGCLCEYIVIPESSCFPVEKEFSFERAALCEPLAIGIYAVHQASLQPDMSIAILGAGPVGLSCLLAARAEGLNDCYMTEIVTERIEVAMNNGATWIGNPDKQNIIEDIYRQQNFGVDVVFECAGKQETIDQAVELLKPGGKLMLIGIPRTDRIDFAIDKLRRKEIIVINVRRQNKCTQLAIDMIKAGSIDPDFMVTHHFKLEQSKEAFELVTGYNDGVVKAMIEFSK
jgi:L-iditol 2-dehydrogenase